MTVCIAAICEEGRAIVVAADRMFTNPGLSVEFETEEQKIEELGRSCVALAAGNSVHSTEILEIVRKDLGGNQNPNFSQLGEMVRKAYGFVRAIKAEEGVIVPNLGVDFLRYKENGVPLPHYLEKQHELYRQLAAMQSQVNLGVDMIVAGLDTSGAHISQVSHPGTLMPLQKLGYATIGSGAIHALTRLSLGGQTAHRPLADTLADVYLAKKASEVAPGVGRATDMAVINVERGVRRCGVTTMNALEAIQTAISQRATPDLNELKGTYNEECNKPESV